jgi:hypothetical protein
MSLQRHFPVSPRIPENGYLHIHPPQENLKSSLESQLEVLLPLSHCLKEPTKKSVQLLADNEITELRSIPKECTKINLNPKYWDF